MQFETPFQLLQTAGLLGLADGAEVKQGGLGELMVVAIVTAAISLYGYQETLRVVHYSDGPHEHASADCALLGDPEPHRAFLVEWLGEAAERDIDADMRAKQGAGTYLLSGQSGAALTTGQRPGERCSLIEGKSPSSAAESIGNADTLCAIKIYGLNSSSVITIVCAADTRKRTQTFFLVQPTIRCAHHVTTQVAM